MKPSYSPASSLPVPSSPFPDCSTDGRCSPLRYTASTSSPASAFRQPSTRTVPRAGLLPHFSTSPFISITWHKPERPGPKTKLLNRRNPPWPGAGGDRAIPRNAPAKSHVPGDGDIAGPKEMRPGPPVGTSCPKRPLSSRDTRASTTPRGHGHGPVCHRDSRGCHARGLRVHGTLPGAQVRRIRGGHVFGPWLSTLKSSILTKDSDHIRTTGICP